MNIASLIFLFFTNLVFFNCELRQEFIWNNTNSLVCSRADGSEAFNITGGITTDIPYAYEDLFITSKKYLKRIVRVATRDLSEQIARCGRGAYAWEQLYAARRRGRP